MFLCFFSNLFIKDLFESRKKQFFFFEIKQQQKTTYIQRILKFGRKRTRKGFNKAIFI